MKKIIIAIILFALIGIGAASYMTHDVSDSLDNALDVNNLTSNNESIDNNLINDDNLTIDDDNYSNSNVNDAKKDKSINKNPKKSLKNYNPNKDSTITSNSGNVAYEENYIPSKVEFLDKDLTKDEIKKYYEDVFGKETNDVKVEVSDLKTLDNGTKFYRINVTERFKGVYDGDEFIDTPEYNKEYDHTFKETYDAISNIKPVGHYGQYLTIDGVMNYIQSNEDNEVSIDEIIKKSREIMNDTNQTLDIFGYDGYYYVDVIDYDGYYHVNFNAHTGEVVYASSNDSYYVDLCNQKIQDRIDSENLNYSKVSAVITDREEGYDNNRLFYDIVASQDGKTEIIGSAVVDVNIQTIVEFNIKNHSIDNQTNDTSVDNDTIDNGAVDNDTNVNSTVDDIKNDSNQIDYEEVKLNDTNITQV